MARRQPGTGARARGARGRWWPAPLTGVGLAGLVDVILFHQLLGWHHFYNRSTQAAGLASDGLLDLALTVALVVGLVSLVETAGPVQRWGRRGWGGILAGFGWFNLFDGVVDHKLLGLHQIRPGVADLLPYDAAWIGLSVLILVVGVGLVRADARAERRADLPA
jgi:uncharacterized membrane protein